MNSDGTAHIPASNRLLIVLECELFLVIEEQCFLSRKKKSILTNSEKDVLANLNVQRWILWLLTQIQLFSDGIYLSVYCYKYTFYAHSFVKSRKSSLPPTNEDDPTCESQVKDIWTVECPSTCNSNKKRIKTWQFY